MTLEQPAVLAQTGIASLWRRFLAFFLDLIGVAILSSFILSWLPTAWNRGGSLEVLLHAVVWLVWVGSPTVQGSSWGQRALGLRLVDAQGAALTRKASLARAALLLPFVVSTDSDLIRWTLPTLSALLTGGGLGLAVVVLWPLLAARRRGQALHDRLSAAWVVRKGGAGRAGLTPVEARTIARGAGLGGIVLVVTAVGLWFPLTARATALGPLYTRLRALPGVEDLELVNTIELGESGEKGLTITLSLEGEPTGGDAWLAQPQGIVASTLGVSWDSTPVGLSACWESDRSGCLHHTRCLKSEGTPWIWRQPAGQADED